MTKRAAVIGLDGAAWHLLDPMLDQGTMPRLRRIVERGAWGTLKSTVPTYTPPAWTSAATGVNPGRHGIYGFHGGHAQDPRQELMHSGKIKAPTIWEIANAQGARAGIYNLPLTYPPRPLDGWMVSGMMTPAFGERLKGFAYPQELEARIRQWAPDYVVDVSSNYDLDWRDTELCRRALAAIRQRRAVLQGLLESDPPDVVFSVLEAPDRLQHVYYRYMDPRDPQYESETARGFRREVTRCFEEMDTIVGLLHDWAGSDGGVVVCSDHGFTAWEVSVHLNVLLERWGYLKLKRSAKAMQTDVARALVPLAKRVLPGKVARQAKTKTFSAIDWSQSQAFASWIPQQGVFVNLQGRERFGIVPPARLEELKDELAERFRALRGPDGEPATDVVYKSQDVFHGDALVGAPDVLPVMRDHRFELDDELFHREPFSDVTDMPRGVHHPDGIVAVAGPGVATGARIGGSVMDVTPTLLYMAGLQVPDDLDGSVLVDAFEPGWLDANPVARTAPVAAAAKDETSPYSEEEEELIEESLRGLGYL